MLVLKMCPHAHGACPGLHTRTCLWSHRTGVTIREVNKKPDSWRKRQSKKGEMGLIFPRGVLRSPEGKATGEATLLPGRGAVGQDRIRLVAASIPGRENGAGGGQRLGQRLRGAEEILSLEKVFLRSARCCQANKDTEEGALGLHRSWWSELLPAAGQRACRFRLLLMERAYRSLRGVSLDGFAVLAVLMSTKGFQIS